MTIEFSNVVPPKGHSAISVAIVVASCAFFFIPTTLIVLGYLSSQPTGTLISPLPQGVISQSTPTPVLTPTPTAPAATVETSPDTATNPIIASPTDASVSAKEPTAATSSSNIIDHSVTVDPNVTEVIVKNADIKTVSQIYLSPRPGDKTIYSVKSKQDGQMTITVSPASDIVRYIDYHIVNP